MTTKPSANSGSPKTLPLSAEQWQAAAERFGTPFHLYDEAAMLAGGRALLGSFSWNKGFKEYFAVKACPNPHIIRALKGIGFGVDCSSATELVIAERLGFRGDDILYTSNVTSKADYQKALELGALINLDDAAHLEFIQSFAKLPGTISFRYNPGAQKTGNAIIGEPLESKFGMTEEQLLSGVARAQAAGVTRIGLHTMVASNEREPSYFVETGEILFALVAKIKSRYGVDIAFVNLGGGLGIPYHPDEAPLDVDAASQGLKVAYEKLVRTSGCGEFPIFMESGRYITGPYGYLVSRVEHVKTTYKTYVGLDATMVDLMRPGMYGAYHHLSVVGKSLAEGSPSMVADVTGSLCENNDKFAINRRIPTCERGDLVVIHDTGAHGHCMGFNYNGKLKAPEVLLRPDGSLIEIRRRQTLADYFATVTFEAF